MLTAIITGIIVVLGLFGTYWYAKRAFIRSLKAYFEAPDEQTPSEFGKVAGSMAAAIGQQVAFHIKQAMLGEASGGAKQMKGIEMAVARAEASGGNLAIESLLNSQSVKAFTRGKPWLLELAGNFLADRYKNKPGSQPARHGNGRFSDPTKIGGF